MATVSDEQDLRELLRLAPLALIGARLRRARREKGLSHDQLGELMGGVTRQHLIKLEKAKHRPGLEMLRRASSALDRPIDYFLVEGSGEPNPFPEATA